MYVYVWALNIVIMFIKSMVSATNYISAQSWYLMTKYQGANIFQCVLYIVRRGDPHKLRPIVLWIVYTVVQTRRALWEP